MLMIDLRANDDDEIGSLSGTRGNLSQGVSNADIHGYET